MPIQVCLCEDAVHLLLRLARYAWEEPLHGQIGHHAVNRIEQVSDLLNPLLHILRPNVIIVEIHMQKLGLEKCILGFLRVVRMRYHIRCGAHDLDVRA